MREGEREGEGKRGRKKERDYIRMKLKITIRLQSAHEIHVCVDLLALLMSRIPHA